MEYWRLFQTAWDFQKEFHKKVQHGKETDTLFLLEHDPVYTLGKNANKNNLLEQPASEVKVFNVERGGDITYHGPGQLVGYPILDLHHYQKNISWFMRTLEEILIQGKKSFMDSGGKNFDMIPCLNDNDDHINLLKNLIQKNI